MKCISLKLMPDYGCHPLWYHAEKVGNVDPHTIPLSQALIRELEAWAARYDARLRRADGAVCVTAAEQLAFERQGLTLLRKLRQELGPAWRVVYFSDIKNRLLYAAEESIED